MNKLNKSRYLFNLFHSNLIFAQELESVNTNLLQKHENKLKEKESIITELHKVNNEQKDAIDQNHHEIKVKQKC